MYLYVYSTYTYIYMYIYIYVCWIGIITIHYGNPILNQAEKKGSDILHKLGYIH